MSNHDEWKSMLAELLAVDEGLTDWELSFIEDIRHLSALTEDQFVKLEQIWQQRIG